MTWDDPQIAAKIASARSLGYSVEILEPESSKYTGCQDPRAGIRRAFACAR